MSLNEEIQMERMVMNIAHTAPDTTKKAVKAYIDYRRRKLMPQLSGEPEWRIQEIQKSLAALKGMEEGLGLDQVDTEEIPMRRPEGLSREEYTSMLAELLTPVGWDEPGGLKMLIDEQLEQACRELAEGENVAMAKATESELRIFLTFLATVARQGGDAKADMGFVNRRRRMHA